jgi:hypothetical protein
MRNTALVVVFAMTLGIGHAAASTPAPAAKRVNVAVAKPTCSREVTGSRIRRREGDCAESMYRLRRYSEQHMEHGGGGLRASSRYLIP